MAPAFVISWTLFTLVMPGINDDPGLFPQIGNNVKMLDSLKAAGK